MGAAPGTALTLGSQGEFHFHFRRRQLQKRGVIGELKPLVGQHLGEGMGQGQLTEFLVVPVILAIGGHVQQLRPQAGRGKTVHQPGRQPVAVGEQVSETDIRGRLAVIEKDVDGAPLPAVLRGPGQKAAVGLGGIQGARRRGPLAAGQGAHALGLIRRQDDELHAVVHQGGQGGVMHRGLRQPHGRRRPPEPVLEVFEAPDDLGFTVPGPGQGQDGVAVGLGQSVTVPQGRQTLGIGLQNPGIGFRRLLLKPADEGGPEIKTEMLIIVDDIQDPPLAVVDPGHAVGAIALGGDAGIPVVVRGGAGLHFDLFDPGIFPGRLIKMAVDDHVSLGRDFCR